MASQDIPLPEISVEEFHQAWTRFELAAVAKEWNAAKQLSVVPALLRGKLLDKQVQGSQERVGDYGMALKKAFKEAFPDELVTSAVLLQRFLTGLRPAITQQILLQKQPRDLDEAIKAATAVEYALSFGKGDEPSVHVVQTQHDDRIKELHTLLQQMSNRFDSVEAQLRVAKEETVPQDTRKGRFSGQRPASQCCYGCGQYGHWKQDCPLARKCYRCGELKSVTRTSAGLEAIGANGLPLNVCGQIRLPMTVESVESEHDFLVAKNLPVECILGMDFLTKYHAVIDCGQMALRLTGADHKLTSQTSDVKGDLSVTLPKTYNIPSRCVMFVTASVQSHGRAIEGLVEQELNIHNTIMVARGLCCAQSNGAVVLQMVNIGPEEVTLYKGTRVAVFSPRNYIMVLSEEDGVKAGGGHTNSNGPVPVDLSKSNLSGEQKSRLRNLLEQFRELFVSDDHALGRTSMVTHRIKTTGPPIQQPLRRLPESLKAVVHKELESMQNKGVVRPSCSPWASPMVLIRKKDGKWRFCVDYRKLNSVTERDAFPLPRVDATLDSLAGSKLFTTLDLASGYWQVEVLEEDKSKSAFPTPYGLFEFNVMPFGLTNAPATFQRLMQCVLAGLSPEQCLTYIDDVIVFSASFEQHLTRLRAVLDRIAKAGLRLKTAKCQFVQRQVKYLGHVVSEQGIEPDPQKTQALKNFPTPTNATMATGFQWSEMCQDAFDTLKNKLISAPILVYPEFDKPFLLYTDASDNAIGGVLGQKHADGEKVIAYWSRQLHKAERQYSTVEKEALAAVSAVKEFYPYLYGFPFTLITDHNPLISLKGLKDIGGRLSRWIIFLQQFNMEFRYKPGKEHSNADCMSRYFPQDAPLISFASQLDLNDMESIKQAQAADAQLIELS
eukprot:Em0021g359a